MSTEDRDVNWASECRKPGCETGRMTDPLPSKAASERQMAHAREAHSDPYIGAKWSLVREAADRPARTTRTRGRGGR